MTKPVTFDRWVIRMFGGGTAPTINKEKAEVWLQANAGVFTWRATNVDNGIVYLTGILRG